MLNVLLYSLPLPRIPIQFGWIAAEIGRQPWIVYRELRTKDAISVVVPAGQILFTILMFTVVYALLAVLFVYLLKRAVQHGPKDVPDSQTREVVA